MAGKSGGRRSRSEAHGGHADLVFGPFGDADGYLRARRGNPLTRVWKVRAEHRALSRCLAGLDVHVVCDCPSGPGRLFDYWHKRGLEIIGVDASEAMAEGARRRLAELNARGRALQANALDLADRVGPVDLVASVRFLYYFGAEARIRMLRALARASRRWLLVQYKTIETRKGRRNAARYASPEEEFRTHAQIADEVREAGLVVRRIVPIGSLSDRVYVLAEKPEAGAGPLQTADA